MKKEKLRSEIPDEYKWDLNKMYDSEEKFETDLELLKEYNKEVLNYKGKIMTSGKNLYNFYDNYIKYDRLATNLYVYSHMKCDQDTKDSKSQALKKKTEKLIEDLETNLSFINPEILAVDYNRVLELINEYPLLEKYKFDLEKTFRYKEHTLSSKEEELVSKASNAMGTGSDAFYNIDNSDIKLDSIKDENDEDVDLNNSNYALYMRSKNRKVREAAFNSMYKYFGGLKNTIASLYTGQIKEDFFDSEIHKFNSPLEQSLYHDNISKDVYINLINTVNNNLDKLYDYVNVRKQILKLDEIHMYDISVELCEDIPTSIPFEEGKKIIFEALKPLGEQYLNDLKKAFDEHWIDVYPNNGKKSGAYSWGTYDSIPYVLLNYVDNTDSVSTMGHELGHSMHSYYSIKNQDYIYHNYPIFLAEIASTTNEILINDYLFKNAKTKNEKILYLNEFLEHIKGTLYRQTMFAEFEMIMHDEYAKGVPLTEEKISSTYYELNKKYYGPEMIHDENIRYEWARIPHFYSPFYVYKYATGISAAIAFASDILNNVDGAKERYLEFLSSGGSAYPLEILKKAGVDMTSSEPIEKALNMFGEKLNELKKLI